MRISDWSSDVCSSDLEKSREKKKKKKKRKEAQQSIHASLDHVGALGGEDLSTSKSRKTKSPATAKRGKMKVVVTEECEGEKTKRKRSEERRVGKESVSTGRSRGTRDP